MSALRRVTWRRLALVGIAVSLAWMGFAQVDRSRRWGRTIESMRGVAFAVESYRVDRNRLPETIGILGLRGALDPQASAALPTEDAWGHMLGFEVFAGDHAPMECYAVWSAGPDGLPSAEGRGYPYLTDEGLGDDLAWVTCGSSDPISFRCGPPRTALIRAWHWLKGS